MYILRDAKLSDLSTIFTLCKKAKIFLIDKGLKEQVDYIPKMEYLTGCVQAGRLFVCISSKENGTEEMVSFALIDIENEVGILLYLVSIEKGAGAAMLRFIEDSLWDEDVPLLTVKPHPTLGPYFGALGYKAEAGCYCKDLSDIGEVTGTWA